MGRGRLRGGGRQVNVVIKFPTEEALQGFYNDPDYLPFKELRLRTTANSTLLTAKEFWFPA